MFSQTVLAGRLGRDPEVRTTSSGKRVLTLRLCTHATVRGRVLTEWHAVTAWSEARIELMVERLHKGDLILVTGQNRRRRPQPHRGRHGAAGPGALPERQRRGRAIAGVGVPPEHPSERPLPGSALRAACDPERT